MTAAAATAMLKRDFCMCDSLEGEDYGVTGQKAI
jgi:hypothetical protein